MIKLLDLTPNLWQIKETEDVMLHHRRRVNKIQNAGNVNWKKKSQEIRGKPNKMYRSRLQPTIELVIQFKKLGQAW